MMWKILTAQIREEIYYSQTSRGLFADEQKGYCIGSRGTAVLLYIDQHILNEIKIRRKYLAMDFLKKAYDIVPQSLIINYLKRYKISEEVRKFIKKTMKTKRVELPAGVRSSSETNIQRGIFQEDAMMPLNHKLRRCTTV